MPQADKNLTEWEQPGPEVPQDPENTGGNPGEQPEDNFDAREWFMSADVVGEERANWVKKRLRDDGSRFYIPYAFKGTYSDFDEQANYEYFKEHYSFLNYEGEGIGFDVYKIEHPGEGEEKTSFETYLSGIDVDEWNQFKQDVKYSREGQCLDDDRSNELRQAAETEYFNDNYKDFIDALRDQSWMHREEYQYLLQAVGLLDADDVAKLCFKHDIYPESEGQGSVYVNFDNAAKVIDPDELLEILDQKDAQEEWGKTKNAVWNDQRSVGYLFDKEMKEQLADQPELLQQYLNMDPRESRAFFDRVLSDAAEFPKNNEYPRWYLWKPGYYDQPKVEQWIVMYPLSDGDWARMSREEKQNHVEGSMYEFVRDYVIPALAGQAHRVPKEHPELPYKTGIRVGRPPGEGDEKVEQYPLEGQEPTLGESEQPTPKEIAKEADKAEEPASAEQAEAGNYQKGHVELHGFDITIENAKGSIRRSKDPKKKWQVTMPAHYGYIRGTVGKDKDHLDVYIGEHPDSTKVYVVNQKKEEGGFDEHKIMLGFETKDEAIATYDKAFTGDLGPKLRDEVLVTNIDGLKEWIASGNTKQPFKLTEALEEPPFDAREYMLGGDMHYQDAYNLLLQQGFKDWGVGYIRKVVGDKAVLISTATSVEKCHISLFHKKVEPDGHVGWALDHSEWTRWGEAPDMARRLLPGEATESLDDPEFDPREYIMAEPMDIPQWLTVKDFQNVANGAWQWENDWHSLFVMEHGFLGAIAWTIEDYDHVTGETLRYRVIVHDKDSTTKFLRLLRKRMEQPQPEPVTEAEVPPEPVPAPSPDDFDPRGYMLEPADSGKLVKDTPTMSIIKPTQETVERFIQTNASGVSHTRIIETFPMYLVIPKNGDPKFLIGIWDDGTLYTPPFPVSNVQIHMRDKPYSKELRRFFRSHALRYLRDDDDVAMGLRMLADLYGPKAVIKYLDKYDAPEDLIIKLGIDAAKRKDFDNAANLLGHDAKLMTETGVMWDLKDWSELSQFFERRYQEGAENVLNGEMDVDWIWSKEVTPKVSDVLRYCDAGDFKTIREVLVHRVIRPMDDEQPMMLSSQNLNDFTDEDIAYWLGEGSKSVDPEGVLDDIREALQRAALYTWETVIKDDWTEGYKNTALSAIDADGDWKDGKFRIFVKWETVVEWLESAVGEGYDPESIDNLLTHHSPKAEPQDDYSKRSWDDADEQMLSDNINDQLAELEPADYPYEPGQELMHSVLGPNPNEYLDITSYSQHSPHGYKTKLKRKDMERWQREEPWRLDPEKWAAYAKEKGIVIPPKEEPKKPVFNSGYYGVGEALADVLLEKTYKYAMTQIDVPAPQSDFIFEWGRANVTDEMLSFSDPDTNPRETEQHVTVLYGLTVNDVPEELRQITEVFKPFPVYIGKVSLFRQEQQDVLKLDVESPWLRKLSAEIRAAIPNENKYPDYHPHITIAYVKKGSCDHLEGADIFQGQPGACDPQFIAYGMVFKGGGDDQGNRAHETLLFTRTKKTRPVESGPFTGVPFPLDPESIPQFLRLARTRARRTIL